MAEAHSAVAFSFQVTHDGVHINYDNELLHQVWLSGVRSWRNRIARFLNNFKNGIYPSSIEFLLSIITIVLICDLILNVDTSFGVNSWLKDEIVSPLLSNRLPEYGPKVVSCIIYGIVLWLMKMLLMRYTLKLLFIYKGWMYESRSSKDVSLVTTIWLVWIKFLTSTKSPMLYSYQASLPRLPLPSLNGTIERYLLSIRPLCDDEKYERLSKLAEQFRDGIGRKFQRYLLLKSWWASNYVSDWWEEFVYLRGRQPLMVNSNFYGIDALIDGPTNRQTSRAANLIYASLLFRKQIDRQELKPIMVQNLVPLCSYQYERVFNTTRIPGVETDRIQHLTDSAHIVVLRNGKFYKLTIHHKGRLLQPKELERLLQKIVDDNSPALPGEQKLASLTAADRITWAKTREQYFAKGINRISLSVIENSAFVVVLEDEKFEYSNEDSSKLDRYGQLLLHGKGNDRWFDKSFNLIVAKNGRVGFNAEHSWADAPIMAHLWEFVLAYDFHILMYNEDGSCKVGNGIEPSPPMRLKWDFSDPLCDIIEKCYNDAQSLLNDVDLRLYRNDLYGKGFMKKCKVSPDAYIQMALQLAYFRDIGNLSLTYEASMTRLFREGRTETVRPVTVESRAWVYSMSDPLISNEQKQSLLRHACNRHQRAYQDAMCGKGVDRHLFCLYVISKYLEVDSPFLKEVLSEPWRLSTSQTPHGQVGLLDNNEKNPKFISAGGGFGPVDDNGYGVSYIVAGEELLFFHISSKRSSGKTDSQRFANNIRRALIDMKNLFVVDGIKS